MNISEFEAILTKMDGMNEYLDSTKRIYQTTLNRLKNDVYPDLMKKSKLPSYIPTHSSRNGYDENMSTTERAMANMERFNAKAHEIQEKSLVMIRKTEEIMSVISDVSEILSNAYLEVNTLQRRAKNVVETHGLIPKTPEQQMAFEPGNVYPPPSPSGEHKGGKKKRKSKRTRKRY